MDREKAVSESQAAHLLAHGITSPFMPDGAGARV